MCISFKSCNCCLKSPRSRAKIPNGKISHKFHILGRTSFCCTSGRSSKDWKPSNGEPIPHQTNVPKAVRDDVFDMEKPVDFTYEEILTATGVSLIQIFLDTGHMVLYIMHFCVTRRLQLKK